MSGNSDGATVALEGRSLLHGHLLLHGWQLSLDSFWTIDALFNAVVEVFTHLSPDVLNIVPALIATFVIVIAIVLCRGLGRRADLIAAGFVLAVLALPSRAFATFFLQGPLHVGTTLWCLIALALLAQRSVGLRSALGVVFLVAGLLGDLQTVAFAIVPLAGAGLISMARERSLRAGFVPIGGAALAAGIAAVVHEIAHSLGGFTTGITNPLADSMQRSSNLSYLWQYLEAIFGVKTGPFAPSFVPGYFGIFHLIVLVIVLASGAFGVLALAARAITGKLIGASSNEQAFVDDVLVFAILGDLVTYIGLPTTVSPSYARYLSAGVIFATILSARYLARLSAHWRSTWTGRVLASAMAALLVLLSISLGFSLRASTPPAPGIALSQFLSAHDLHEGVGDYWAASITTVDSDGSVVVRPVVANIYGKLVRYAKQTDDAWFAGQHFDFVVVNIAAPYGAVDLTTTELSFGRPKHVYRFKGYLIFDYATHPFTVSLQGAIGS